MKFAITNSNCTKFLTGRNGGYAWTDNIQLAYTFSSEEEAAHYEEKAAGYFLNFETDIFSYINEVSELLGQVSIRARYLDYVNNFLSVERFAEYYNLTVEEAETTIRKGRELHENFVATIK